MHIQGELRQRVEALDFGGEKVVYRMADADVFAHDCFRRRQGIPHSRTRLRKQWDVSGIASQASVGPARTDLGLRGGLAPDTKRGDSKLGEYL
jgi:hypothetical protein